MRVHPPRVEPGAPEALRTLQPAYFALVMATGIVAMAASLHGWTILGQALSWLNGCFYVALAALTAARIARYPRAFAGDLQSHERGVGFFTVVAATGVLGIDLATRGAAPAAVAGLLAAGWVLWALVTYGVLGALTVAAHKPALEDALNGGWLVAVVAAQSVAVLTVLVAAGEADGGIRPPLVFAAVTLWLCGAVLYLWLTGLILVRWLFGRLAPADLSPPYWINMGAAAISSLAGSTLVEHLALAPALADLRGAIAGGTLLFWAIGTWWIPLLLVLAVWRHLVREVPLRYDPLYWSAVFPLGMYSVCTRHLATTLDLPFLLPVSSVFLCLAVIAWAATLAGLADALLRQLHDRASAATRGR